MWRATPGLPLTVGLFFVALAGRAHAQDKPAPAKPDAPAAESITITAAPQAFRNTLDRRSFSIANDLQKDSSSLADALRNIPFVEVDLQGNVSLRGDPSVTILIDGKPSSLLSGTNRADVLLSLPAGQFERVEVMTNPSAAYTPDGTGGIINLISKQTRVHSGATASGQITANISTGRRYNGAVTGAYSQGGLSLSGGANIRHNAQVSDSTVTFGLPDPVTGALVPAHQIGRNALQATLGSIYGNLDYDLDKETRLSFGLNRFEDRSKAGLNNHYRSDALSRPLALDYDSAGAFHGHYVDNSATAGYLRKFPDADHELSLHLKLEAQRINVRLPNAYSFQAPAQPDQFQDVSGQAVFNQAELKAEYKTPLPHKAKLTAGYEGTFEVDRFEHGVAFGTGPATEAPVAAFANLFKFEQQVHALYATYEQAFGKLSVQPGLRVEAVSIDTDQVTTHTKGGQDYVEAYPTLHLGYEIDDRQQLKASFGRRVQRPYPEGLNPLRIYNTNTSQWAGNPNLKPAITQSFELAYEYRRKATYYLATLYYRDNAGLFTPVVTDLGGGVLLNTQGNLGHSRNSGLELVANTKLTKTLSINASTNLFYSAVDPTNLGIVQGRSATVVSGRVSLDWQATKHDFLQLSAYATGKQLTAQGYRTPFTTLNLGWRHRFDDKLSGVVTVQDPFDNYRQRFVIDTPSLKETSVQTPHQRALFIGFTYALGASTKRAPEIFDFGGGGGGPPPP